MPAYEGDQILLKLGMQTQTVNFEDILHNCCFKGLL